MNIFLLVWILSIGGVASVMVCACSHGSTKLVFRVSEITEDPISHRSFSLEIMYNMSKKIVFDKKNSVTE